MFWKNKYRRKYVGERKRRIEGSRILFLRDGGGGIFGVFLELFFCFLEEEEDNL